MTLQHVTCRWLTGRRQTPLNSPEAELLALLFVHQHLQASANIHIYIPHTGYIKHKALHSALLFRILMLSEFKEAFA